MSLPTFTGTGYLAGEAPDGLTTVVSVPVTATVQVLWRDPDTDDEHLVASTTSAPDGTWRITGLNHELNYIVRGIKAGWNDVTVVGAAPTRMDLVTATGTLETNEDGNGVAGSMLIEGGLPPYSVSVIDPLPYGLTPVFDYRTLTIAGTSDDWGRWRATVRVTASNAVFVDVPVTVDVNANWTPERLSIAPKVWLDWDSAIQDASGSGGPNGYAQSWADRSGGQSFYATGVPTRPLVVASAVGGKRALRFDGSDDFLVASSPYAGAVFRATGVGWSFSVMRKRGLDASPTGRALIYAPVASGATRFQVALGTGAAGNANRKVLFARRRDSDGTAGANFDVGTTDWSMDLATMSWATAQAMWRTDGAAVSTLSVLTPGNTDNTQAHQDRLAIGADGGPAGFNGTASDVDLACVIIGSGSSPTGHEQDAMFGWAAWACSLTSKLPSTHPFKTRPPYAATPALQMNIASALVVLGFTTDTSGAGVGAAIGPAVTAQGVWFNGGPSLSAGQGVSVMSDGDDITVTLIGITPAATPAQAVLLDHKGMSIATIPLTASGSDYSGSVPGALDEGEVYYLRIEAA